MRFNTTRTVLLCVWSIWALNKQTCIKFSIQESQLNWIDSKITTPLSKKLLIRCKLHFKKYRVVKNHFRQKLRPLMSCHFLWVTCLLLLLLLLRLPWRIRLFVLIIFRINYEIVNVTGSWTTCGGGLESLHRSPASRRRRWKGNSVTGDITRPLSHWGT
jgi:hypothetical protein